MTTRTEHEPIPQPKPDPILKNINDLDPKGPVQSMIPLARTCGPIYRLSLPGGHVHRRTVLPSDQRPWP
jgi:hypothetical protein